MSRITKLCVEVVSNQTALHAYRHGLQLQGLTSDHSGAGTVAVTIV